MLKFGTRAATVGASDPGMVVIYTFIIICVLVWFAVLLFLGVLAKSTWEIITKENETPDGVERTPAEVMRRKYQPWFHGALLVCCYGEVVAIFCFDMFALFDRLDTTVVWPVMLLIAVFLPIVSKFLWDKLRLLPAVILIAVSSVIFFIVPMIAQVFFRGFSETADMFLEKYITAPISIIYIALGQTGFYVMLAGFFVLIIYAIFRRNSADSNDKEEE